MKRNFDVVAIAVYGTIAASFLYYAVGILYVSLTLDDVKFALWRFLDAIYR